jgi:acetyl-CoA acetyltransferase
MPSLRHRSRIDMDRRYPIRDAVAIVGVGQTQYARTLPERTPMSLALEASRLAIRDAGLDKTEIDGICGTQVVDYQYLREGLGVGDISWSLNGMRSGEAAGMMPPHLIAAAAMAVFSGSCEVALVAYSHIRAPVRSKSAPRNRLRDSNIPEPQRRRQPTFLDDYASWAGRYLHDYGLPRDVFGYCCVNNRSNAVANPSAVLREPLTLEDYLQQPMLREPLGMFDMDLPVDGGDALVITTPERARDLRKPVVRIHAMALCEANHTTPHNEQGRSYTELSHFLTVRKLWARSDLSLGDVNVFYPYDGFSNIWTSWIEAVGYCEPGGALDFIRQHWDNEENRLKINRRVVVSSDGGSMSHGASQGFSYFHEAVEQLRGHAGPRQVPDASVALVTPGGFFFNSTAFLLQRD